MPYNFTAIEKKWQQYWLEKRSFRALEQSAATDIICRYLRMKGYNVLHPMGWDAFGLPAEQYAIKTNTHPRITTEQNIETFRRQIRMLGLSYDWDREVDTT